MLILKVCMWLKINDIAFLIATVLTVIGLMTIIYWRNRRDRTTFLFILMLLLSVLYLISHSIHFLFMHTEVVTALDLSCHSLLLLMIVTLTFFTWNFPVARDIGWVRTLLIIIPTIIILILLWTDQLIIASHIHMQIHRYEAHYTKLYPLYLIWYAVLISLNIYWLVKKYIAARHRQIKTQLLLFLLGVLITNILLFTFGFLLPWIVGFYFLIEMSPLAFLSGVVLFTSVAVGKYNMFPAAFQRVKTFSINKKIFFSALILVPIIILLVEIPLVRIIFNINSNTELLRFFYISLIGGLIVSVSMAFVIIQIISNPLANLKRNAIKIEEGNYGTKVDILSNDEIGELAEAFNSMSQTLKNNTEELIKKEKLAALGEMAAVLAHEIKNPLTSIKMNVDILEESLQLKNNDEFPFSIMKKEINRLNNLVKDVLQFSSQMDLVCSDLDIKSLISEILFQLTNKLEKKNISVINKIESNKLSADYEKLKQVFFNLLDNSIESIDKDGSIEIISHSENNNLYISIKDSGNGIENTDKIFEPFFTTKASGTGLGLSVSQKIIEQHGGKIKLITSSPGETIFEISIPV